MELEVKEQISKRLDEHLDQDLVEIQKFNYYQ